MRVAIMESLGITEEELAARKKPFEEKGVTFAEYQRTGDTAELIERGKDADAMILANMPLPASVISACENLKFIDIAFTGVDHVGLDAAREKKITVSNASGYSNEAVAELALGMTLSVARNLRAVEDRCREGKDKTGLVGWELKGKTVGIVGLGKIGTRSAELFHAFGARVISYSRTTHQDAPSYVTQTTFDEVLSRSDVVVLHCPLTEETRGLIGAAQLKQMKPSAILVNVARGPVVVTQDLAEALQNKTIAGAAIDVFDTEPPLETSHTLLRAPHVLVTPHVAFATVESMSLRAEIVFDNLEKWMNGTPVNVVA